MDVLVCVEPPLLADDEVEVWVDEEFDPSAPDVVDEPVEVPVWADPPLPEVDDPDAPVVAEAEPEPDEPVVEAPVPVFVLLLSELPVVAVEPLEVVVEAEPEPDVLVGEGVGDGVGQVVVPLSTVEVPDDGWVPEEPPDDVDDELPVVVFAEELPGEVEVEDVVLVEALAPPPLPGFVGVGVWELAVWEPVVVCVFDPVAADVGDGVGLGVGAGEEVFQFAVKLVVVFPVRCDPWIETGGVTVTVGVVVGVVLAEVLEVLWVVELPPLTDGWTLIIGWILIDGATVMVALLEALIIMPRA